MAALRKLCCLGLKLVLLVEYRLMYLTLTCDFELKLVAVSGSLRFLGYSVQFLVQLAGGY